MASSLPEPWAEGALPPNVRVGPNSIIAGAYAFKRFRSRLNPALVIGSHCTMDGTHFALGEEGRAESRGREEERRGEESRRRQKERFEEGRRGAEEWRAERLSR